MKRSLQLTASEVADIIGTDARALKVLVNAERNGKASTDTGVLVWHTGYQDGATRFEAATSLFTVSA